MNDLQSKLAALKARVSTPPLSEVASIVLSEKEGDRIVSEAVETTKAYLAEHQPTPAPKPELEPTKKGKSKKGFETRPLLAHEITPIITAALLQGARGEKVGEWIWLWDLPQVTPLETGLLAEGFRWCKSKKSWAKGEIKNFRKGYIPKKMNQIRDRYGSQEIKY